MITTEQRQIILDGEHPNLELKDIGLKGRGGLYVYGDNCVRLIKRKSRVLRKDAEAFVDVLSVASSHVGRTLQGHLLIADAPLCSKAKRFLEDRGILVDRVE